MNIIELAQKSPDAILALANSNFSGLNGADQNAINKVGYKSPWVDYFGDKDGSLVNAMVQPVSFSVANSKDADRSFYLSYGEDSTVKGALKTVGAAFAAIDDTGSDTSLTATNGINSQNLVKILNYFRRNPGFCPVIIASCTEPGLFKNTFVEVGERFNPLNPQSAKPYPVSSFKREGMLRGDDNFIIEGKFIISDETTLKFTVPAESTLTLQLNGIVALSKVKFFESLLLQAAAASIANPETVQAVQIAQETKRLNESMR